MKMIQDIIIKPVISEASMDMMEQENGTKKYVFKVMKNATKPEIAKAVDASGSGLVFQIIIFIISFSSS